MKTILIRADSSKNIGTGHITRTLVLVKELKEKSFNVIYLSRSLPGNINFKIKNSGFELIELQSSDKRQEIDEVSRIIKQKNASFIVFDHYGIDEEYEREIKKRSGILVFSFDDTYQKHFCDILLNQNIYAKKEDYKNLVPSSAYLLCGVEYALIRKEFREIEIRDKKHIDLQNVRILVTLGGADPKNVTLEVMKALEESKGFKFHADIVVGAANEYLPELQKFAKKSNKSYRIITDAKNMAELMNKADIAVISCGTTSIEALYMRLPFLALKLADNQEKIYEYLSENGYAMCVENETDDIKRGFENLIFDKTLRIAFLERMKTLRIGKVEKVTKAIICKMFENFSIREAEEKDINAVFEISNDEIVRKNSFSSEKIPFERHKEWFLKKLKDENTLFLIVEKDGTVLGQIRFEKSENDYFISISLASIVRGCGYASDIISKSVESFRNRVGDFDIYAYIKKENIASIKSFEKSGFKKVEETLYKSIPTFVLKRLKNDKNR
ncbi:UDP-2,4-diacetamido-2,4,6-trideoxy-beta-L-altropyranose hydrolase [Nitrosophilus alvini]|uniref:UDP-2,4-diacetamido-2,4, 6-trideoxy-beta-L-altropyranose hydrolase n=1 Tax=Nitrosophilus alvini TaxID=2714855 RepID=UPI00190BCDBB|nr:UDP-2,4-diacetamido-2,4,6-trideoxy-beta-L-altropyranose hydrolase [Nitrosophilus alvini]